jgi:hypothetical protein
MLSGLLRDPRRICSAPGDEHYANQLIDRGKALRRE